MDADKVYEFERERWKTAGWQRVRDKAVNQLKGQAASATVRRIDILRYLNQIVDQVADAWEALGCEPGERLGGKSLARELSRLGVVTRAKKEGERGVDPTTLSEDGKKWAEELLYADDALIKEAVKECRTRMTAICLSANFERFADDGLEAEYVEIIADIIALGRRLRNELPLRRGDLLIRAHTDAMNVAKEQRLAFARGGEGMFERAHYWLPKLPPIKEAFSE